MSDAGRYSRPARSFDRALAAAVITRAIKDLHGPQLGPKLAAHRFLRPDSPILQLYCDALDLEPDALTEAARKNGPAWMRRFSRPKKEAS